MKKAYFILITIFTLTCFVKANSYSEEMKQAHKYAFEHGITTIENIDKAGMYSDLNRISMAKMISNFAINILGLEPDYSLNCIFKDVSLSKDAQYDYGVTKACQLGLMGIGDSGDIAENFNPYGVVTRAQFATAFSRALNRAEGSIISNGEPYYIPHIDYLYNKGVINNLNTPASNPEKRGYVMLMMHRTSLLLDDIQGRDTKLEDAQGNNTKEDNSQENTDQGDISQLCNTDESCLEYLYKIREEKHEMTCISTEGLFGKDTTYIIEGHVADTTFMLSSLYTDSDSYFWGTIYGENSGIYLANTGGDIVTQELSALSKILSLGTPLSCTPGVDDKSVFQIPDNIEFVGTDDIMEKNLIESFEYEGQTKLFSINGISWESDNGQSVGIGGSVDNNQNITSYYIIDIDPNTESDTIVVKNVAIRSLKGLNYNLNEYNDYVYLKLLYSDGKISDWSLVDIESSEDLGKLEENELIKRYLG